MASEVRFEGLGQDEEWQDQTSQPSVSSFSVGKCGSAHNNEAVQHRECWGKVKMSPSCTTSLENSGAFPTWVGRQDEDRRNPFGTTMKQVCLALKKPCDWTKSQISSH